MLYHLHDLTQAALAPWRTAAQIGRWSLNNPANPWSYTYPGKATAAAFEVFDSLTRQYQKPAWQITSVGDEAAPMAVAEDVIEQHPFCHLRRFRLDPSNGSRASVLVVAPMSGHFASLLRGTVAALVEHVDVYVTDWQDARDVPLSCGRFGLDEYITQVLHYIKKLGPNLHVLAVCQPGPAVLAATALLAADCDPMQPASVTLMGSPIDTRKSPTEPNRLAKTRPLSWFQNNVVMAVPLPHPGAMRQVYPGFLQLGGFMSMNLDRHLDAHKKLFENLVAGDGESVAAHREFYDEYLAVMDLSADYYLDTIVKVFQQHQLAEGTFEYGGRAVDLAAIKNTALMTVEGENDDISGIGQTQAAHDLCRNIPTAKRLDYVQPGVGHYGVFNGRKWRTEIAPRIVDFINANATTGKA